MFPSDAGLGVGSLANAEWMFETTREYVMNRKAFGSTVSSLQVMKICTASCVWMTSYLLLSMSRDAKVDPFLRKWHRSPPANFLIPFLWKSHTHHLLTSLLTKQWKESTNEPFLRRISASFGVRNGCTKTTKNLPNLYISTDWFVLTPNQIKIIWDVAWHKTRG